MARPSPSCAHDDDRLRLPAASPSRSNSAEKKESTDPRLSQLCPPYVTPSSSSSLEYHRSDARIVENGFAAGSGMSNSAKVGLVRSMRLDAGDIDRFLPQGDVGGDHRRERFGGVAERVDTERGKPLGKGRVLDGPRHLFRDPVDGLPGRRRRRHQTVPGERLKSRKSRLAEGGNIGKLPDALLARHRT